MADSLKSKSSDDIKQTQVNVETASAGLDANKQVTAVNNEDFGYYFYPEREGKKDKSLFQKVWQKDDAYYVKCQANVKSCFESNPKVRLLAAALESHGCPVNVQRHVSCEPCIKGVSGGFDPKTMQVVLCQNNIQKQDITCNVIAHELLHAFDYCRAKVNFEDLRHLACTEIRAANMFHCSLGAAAMTGEASPFNVKERHQLCIKNKALQSIMLVRDVSETDAMTAVDEVFDRCYADMEPLGRRCFKNLGRAKRALEEARNYYDFP